MRATAGREESLQIQDNPALKPEEDSSSAEPKLDPSARIFRILWLAQYRLQSWPDFTRLTDPGPRTFCSIPNSFTKCDTSPGSRMPTH